MWQIDGRISLVAGAADAALDRVERELERLGGVSVRRSASLRFSGSAP
ncbi:hypothetical protein [Sphingomonas oleivorans]|nr:hypothetical protein [Sphingomonas oleivorans]